jgi:hypothetical protein
VQIISSVLQNLKAMKSRFYISIAALLFMLMPLKTIAQEIPDTLTIRVEMFDGNEFIGDLIRQDTAQVVINTPILGELTIPRSAIKKLVIIEQSSIIDGKLWGKNPQAARYFWTPNGYGLKAGEGYYQNVWVLFNQVSVGVSDHFSLGGGIVPLFLFAGTSSPVWLTPKFSIPVSKDRLNLGAGALLGTVLGESDTGFGILYGIATFGGQDKNLSTGFGYGFAGGEWTNAPIVNISAMIRTGPRGYFLTENYYFSNSVDRVVVVMAGGRYLIKKASIDYGLVLPIFKNQDQFFFIPWLGIVFPF